MESRLIEVATRPRGECSGVRVEREVELIEEVLRAHVHGMSQRSIARATGLSRMTVAGILERAAATGRIRPVKDRVARALARAVEAASEQMCEAIEAGLIPAAQLSVPLGIMTDKMLLLAGEATARVEHVRREVEPADVAAELAELRARAIEVPARVVAETAGTRAPEGQSAGQMASLVAYDVNQ